MNGNRCLKPDMGKKAKNKTQTKKKTLNPEFNEVCCPSVMTTRICSFIQFNTGLSVGVYK